ncbi:hypothetical protein B0T14DRAFT_502627 [Immersiella caudata]|uniref:Uncharacterized protein n=1 Tax=Immersiella caudata TaxID=314043 RepID=A0AA40CB46_9PEZI|nr:hypothetical protein B0T14DRAFT_502627 [Immersiella caudata]
MSRVSISKSYAVLVGLETYVKVRRKGKDTLRKITRGKERLVALEEHQRRKEEELEQSESAKREREMVAEEENLREENTVSAGVMQAMRALGVGPREPREPREAEGGG